jgi:LuxR family maltose regulon positive regulatory protein
MVFRRGLFARLAGAERVTQLTAPAGCGKTFLLRSWIGETGLADQAAWVSVPRAERDPRRFWLSVADALRETPAGGARLRAATAATGQDGWTLVERLLADLRSLPERIWLVIDDVHELNSHEALRQLELLVTRGPARLRVVFATRREVRLGLHRLRLEGELTEIRAADLRFSLEEARTLLETAGVVLPDPVLAILHERTEGWAAGLRLAALALSGHPDPERFAAEFSGSERTVAEYLLAEVLERQPEEVQQLLLRTSVLEQVSGPLADSLSGRSGGERILQELEEAGAFVVSVDARRSWFRYHQLFAEVLQRELRCSAPGDLPALHAAAAQWYAEHGYPVEAVRHAQAAHDWALAARLLADHLLDLVFLDGQGDTVRELLAEFPPGVQAADAELAALLAAGEITGGSLEAAERQLAVAAQGSASVEAGRRGHLAVSLAILRLSVAAQRGDLPVVVEQAQRLLAPATPADAALVGNRVGEDLRAVTLTRQGTAEVWSLRAEEAERHLELAVALARRLGLPFVEVSALAHSAWAASSRSFALTSERGTEATELAERHGWGAEPAVAAAYLAVGVTRVWQLRLEEAEPLLDQAERALRPEVQPAVGLLLRQARGMLALARGREAEALAAFEVPGPLEGLLVPGHPAPVVLRTHRLQVLIRLGETDRAAQALSELGDQQGGGGEIRVATAALRLAQGNPKAAGAALVPVLDRSVPVTSSGWLIQAFLLAAISGEALGDPAAASGALEQALDLAAREGAFFAFALHPVAELLSRHAAGCTAHAGLVTEILGLLVPGSAAGDAPGEDHPGLVPGSTGPMQALTDSETRILHYLPTNLSAPEIADQLSVSVNTVRTHMRHVYEKLGAHRRAGAVNRARALGLLGPSPHRA